MKAMIGFVVWVSVVAVAVFSGSAQAGSENVDLFMEQLRQGPEAVTVSLSEMSSEELLELCEKAAPVVLKEGESGRVMAGILESLAASWEDDPSLDTILDLIVDEKKDPMFRWSLIECFGGRKDCFSDTAANLLLEDLIGIVVDKNDDGAVRRKAAITISLLASGSEAVRSTLVTGLEAADLRVVEGCAYGLRNVENKQNAGALLAAISRLEQQQKPKKKGQKGGFSDKQFSNTRSQLALALAAQQDPESVEGLGNLLSSVDDESVKGSVLYGLSRMECLEALSPVLANNYRRARYLRKAEDLLLEALTGQQLPESVNLVDVIRALGEIECRDAADRLRELSNSSDENIASAAAEALALIGE